MTDSVKSLPSVDQILNLESTSKLLRKYRREHVTTAVRQALQQLREELLTQAPTTNGAARAEGVRALLASRVESMVAEALGAGNKPSLYRVINATGVILHTGLGRAPLPAAAVNAVTDAAGYCSLELDLESGERGSRFVHIEPLVCELSGAEAAVVVNNNAGAVLLMLSVLARDREVIVSRGELVEIGGSFRIPDIIEASGATICEVGTTNRTHLHDYERAVSENTGLILAVHPSNYRVEGFTSGVDLRELVKLGERAGVPVAYDLGGGALLDLEEQWGVPPEPVVGQALETGVDVVSFSADKILGGPQAGIIAGKECWVQAMRNHPMMRALRCDKLILAALEATLKLFNVPAGEITEHHPVLGMLCEPPEQTKARAQRLLDSLSPPARDGLSCQIEASKAQAGSGALPLVELPSWALSLASEFCTVEHLAQQLRRSTVPIVGRVQRERLLLDMRTVSEGDVETVATAIEAVLPSPNDADA